MTKDLLQALEDAYEFSHTIAEAHRQGIDPETIGKASCEVAEQVETITCAALDRLRAESQPVDRVIFDRALAGLPLLNLRIPMPPVKKP